MGNAVSAQAARSVAVITLLSAMWGCGAPMGPIPGGTLEGPEAGWPEDWKFTDEIENILLETNPEDPYSVTLWGVAVEEHFYVAGASSDSTWVAHILRQSDVRLAVNDMLYAGRAIRVTDAQELRAVGDAYTAKYEIDTSESSTFIEDGGIIFRLTKR